VEAILQWLRVLCDAKYVLLIFLAAVLTQSTSVSVTVERSSFTNLNHLDVTYVTVATEHHKHQNVPATDFLTSPPEHGPTIVFLFLVVTRHFLVGIDLVETLEIKLLTPVLR